MRYITQDLPTVGATAFTPLASTNPIASSFGTVKRTAAMGLQPVHVDTCRLPLRSFDPKTSDSNNAPDYILPDQWVAYANNMGPEADAGVNMTLRRRAPLPVPAAQWILAPRRAMQGPGVGGRMVQPNPRAFQRFPIGGGTSA